MSYMQRGSNFFHYNSSEGILDLLGPDVYTVRYDAMGGYYLAKCPNMELPDKLYGNTESFSSRVLNTFRDKGSHMGVLLEGTKGSGKSLQAKKIVSDARELGMPAIKVEESYHGAEFNEFIGKIAQPFVLLFDEFEKVYDSDDQKPLLSLLDGTINAQFLAVMTVNDLYRLDSHLINRPGRIHYHVRYSSLEDEVVSEYCLENLAPEYQVFTGTIMEIAKISGGFNFDMLKCLVEEVNRYGEEPRDALKYLNIDLGNDSCWDVTTVEVGNIIILGNYCHGDDDTDIHPLSLRSLSLNFNMRAGMVNGVRVSDLVADQVPSEDIRLNFGRDQLAPDLCSSNSIVFKVPMSDNRIAVVTYVKRAVVRWAF